MKDCLGHYNVEICLLLLISLHIAIIPIGHPFLSPFHPFVICAWRAPCISQIHNTHLSYSHFPIYLHMVLSQGMGHGEPHMNLLLASTWGHSIAWQSTLFPAFIHVLLFNHFDFSNWWVGYGFLWLSIHKNLCGSFHKPFFSIDFQAYCKYLLCSWILNEGFSN